MNITKRSAMKSGRDWGGIGGVAWLVTNVIANRVSLSADEQSLLLLGVGAVLGVAYRYARDRGWLMPTVDPGDTA